MRFPEVIEKMTPLGKILLNFPLVAGVRKP